MSQVVRSVLGLFLVGTLVVIVTVVTFVIPDKSEKITDQPQVDIAVNPVPDVSDSFVSMLKEKLGIETLLAGRSEVSDSSVPAEVPTLTTTPGLQPSPTLSPVSELSPSIVNSYPTYTTQTNTYVTSNIDLGQLAKSRLLYINDSNGLGALGEGESGQILQSNGSGGLPSWVSLNSTGISGGVITGDQLRIGAGYPLEINNDGRLLLNYDGDSGYLSSSGGAIFIDNTDNVGTGIGIYSNAGSEALGNMINVKVDNPLYNQAAFYMNYDGLSNAVEIVSNSDDSSSNALAVTGNNINDSTLGIIGYELGKGTIKVSHYRPGSGNDQNASAISVDLKGVGTRAQGLYVDSTETGGTLGNLLRLRNESIDKFVVNYQGNLTMTGNIIQGAYGTDTTYTKYGNTTGDQFFVGTNGSFRVQRAASNSEAFRVQISGDTQGRWVGTSDGRLRWGDGSNASDVTLRRGATGILWLDGGIVLNNLNESYSTVIKGVNDSNLLVANSVSNAIGIGLSQPLAPLHISKNGGGNAAVIIDQLGNADVLTASSSGVTKFKLTQTGDVVLSAGAALQPISDATNALNIKTSTGSGVVSFDTLNARVGIGTTAPGSALHVVGGDIWLENGQALRIKNNAGSASPTLSYTSGNNLQLYNYASSGIVQIGINNVGNTSGNLRFFTNNNVERFRIDPAGVGVGATSFGSNAANVLAIASSTAPTTSITDGIQLFAVDQTGSHELRVRDEAGNISTISPHNFSLIPEGRSEDLAWAFYSERGNLAINADMTRALRIVEALSGEQVLFVKDLQTNQYVSNSVPKLELSQFPTVKLNNPQLSQAETDAFLTSTLSGYLRRDELNRHLSLTDTLMTFLSEVRFSASATFEQAVAFLGNVTFGGTTFFRGPVVFNRDTAGSIQIPAGAKTIKVSFSQPFSEAPLVYLTPNQSTVSTYHLEAVTTEGFVIKLDQPAAADQTWQWLAVVSQGNAGQVEVLETEAVAPPAGGATVVPSSSSTPPTGIPEPSQPNGESDTATDSGSNPLTPVANTNQQTGDGVAATDSASSSTTSAQTSNQPQ